MEGGQQNRSISISTHHFVTQPKHMNHAPFPSPPHSPSPSKHRPFANQAPANHGKVVTQFYLTSDGLLASREQREAPAAGGHGRRRRRQSPGPRAQASAIFFLSDGYAFLAVGYFGAPVRRRNSDRIAIDAVRDAILKAAQDPSVEMRCIMLIGGSMARNWR